MKGSQPRENGQFHTWPLVDDRLGLDAISPLGGDSEDIAMALLPAVLLTDTTSRIRAQHLVRSAKKADVGKRIEEQLRTMNLNSQGLVHDFGRRPGTKAMQVDDRQVSLSTR